MAHQKLIVINLGGSNAQNVAQLVRECNIYCEILPSTVDKKTIVDAKPKGIIITGGLSSVPESRNEKVPWLGELDIPVLEVGQGTAVSVEALHGGMGRNGLNAFLKCTCGFVCDWSIEKFTEEATETIRNTVGEDKILLGLSGGVESYVTAALLSKAVGEQLVCIFINNGLLRKNEDVELVSAFSEHDMTFCKVNAETKFLYKLLGVSDPNQKRKIIEEEFIRIFEHIAIKHSKTAYLAKGTTYSDILNSSAEYNNSIVSDIKFSTGNYEFKGIVEPLKSLFKEEVHKLGINLGLPECLLNRQPFPGTGLGVRCVGVITKERLDILREADAIFREEIINAKLDSEISQYFAVITDIKSTGIRNGKKTYEYTITLRAVKTEDNITAEWVEVPFDVLHSVSRRITTEVSNVNRVLYDITDKPPATIEWE